MSNSYAKSPLVLTRQRIQSHLVKSLFEQTAAEPTPVKVLNQKVDISPKHIVKPSQRPPNPHTRRIRGGDGSLMTDLRNPRTTMAAAKFIP